MLRNHLTAGRAGRRKPSTAAKLLLKIAERHPEVFIEAAA